MYIREKRESVFVLFCLGALFSVCESGCHVTSDRQLLKVLRARHLMKAYIYICACGCDLYIYIYIYMCVCLLRRVREGATYYFSPKCVCVLVCVCVCVCFLQLSYEEFDSATAECMELFRTWDEQFKQFREVCVYVCVCV